MQRFGDGTGDKLVYCQFELQASMEFSSNCRGHGKNLQKAY
jgi:hypothetical protein